MDIQYFKSAWGDIKNSPGWFGKLCLLALLNLIPIFGQIVTFGYLFGWAREIAWGTHEPMPTRIFANEDGKLFRRGWFIFVLVLVFALVPELVVRLGDYLQGMGIASTFFNQEYVANPVLVGFGSLISILGTIALVIASVLAWIGSMRVALYDRLSAGFQFGKIWKMLRHDTNGILRIFGMELLFGLIFGIILALVYAVFVGIVISAGIAGLANAGYTFYSFEGIQYMSQTQLLNLLLTFVTYAGPIAFVSVLIATFVTLVASVFVDALVIRALGYWTMQFDVSMWGGQDDPLPFELRNEQQTATAYQAPDQVPVNPASNPPVSPYAPTSTGYTEPVSDSAASEAYASQPAQSYYYQPTSVSESAQASQAVIQEPESVSQPTPQSTSPYSVSSENPIAGSSIADSSAAATMESSIAEPTVGSDQTSSIAAQVAGRENMVTYHAAPAYPSDSAYSPDGSSESHGAHGIQDSQAGNTDIGEDGHPHIGESQDR